MYSVNGNEFESFLDAVQAAKVIKAEVIEVATGKRRWAPGTTPLAALRRYQERKAAYDAQERAKK
jgi:hypothetical protein